MSQQVQGSSANQRFNESAQHANINRRVSAQTMSCRKLNLDDPGLRAIRTHRPGQAKRNKSRLRRQRCRAFRINGFPSPPKQ
jgi:hypothetical protein